MSVCAFQILMMALDTGTEVMSGYASRRSSYYGGSYTFIVLVLVVVNCVRISAHDRNQLFLSHPAIYPKMCLFGIGSYK